MDKEKGEGTAEEDVCVCVCVCACVRACVRVCVLVILKDVEST
jgi:hypothetical protein